jgi:hypothetical protein
MTARATYPPTLEPLEQYAAQYDELFVSPQQRQAFRNYLTGLLEPRERNKTLTALAGAEPVVQATHAAVQRLQYFLSESPWDAEKINDRRVRLLMADPVTRPHEQGVLVIDDTGHRKDGHATAHVARQYLGSVGKTDNGIVVVSTLWADEKVYYPLHLAPYTPAEQLPDCEHNPDFATKAQLAVRLATRARRAGVPFAAVVADCWYGDSQRLTRDLDTAGLPFVVALKPHVKRKDKHTSRHKGEGGQDATARLVEVAKALPWDGPDNPGPWRPVTRRFRDGGTATWWAADASFGQWGPDEAVRLVVATADPGRLPPHNTWFLVTNRPCPGGPRQAHSRYPSADLAEVVRCYGLRNWVEQGYKQVKQELGWADFQVRSDTAIRRHLTLVCTAFSFCWQDWFTHPPPDVDPPPPSGDRAGRQGKGPTQQSTVDEEVAPGPDQATTAPRWPQTLRRVRAWLGIATMLARIWRGWSDEPPPAPLQALLSAAAAGQPIYTYLALPP